MLFVNEIMYQHLFLDPYSLTLENTKSCDFESLTHMTHLARVHMSAMKSHQILIPISCYPFNFCFSLG